MGSRATDTLKEIEALRSGIERKLGDLETRFPLAGFGRRAAAIVAGGSAGGTALAFLMRRVRGGRRKRASKVAAQTPSVTVNVFPKGASWMAALGVAVWGGARLYEVYVRSRSSRADQVRPAVVRPMPDSGRQTSAGP
ncbi:MAG: hypothetical protein ACRDKJ_10870 [Actinomycetota bacterium]